MNGVVVAGGCEDKNTDRDIVIDFSYTLNVSLHLVFRDGCHDPKVYSTSSGRASASLHFDSIDQWGYFPYAPWATCRTDQRWRVR